MAGHWSYEGPQALPNLIPIFPLAGALLLPGGQLPLNIFERRYIEMVDDALKSHRLIGMIQPESEAEAVRVAPKLAEVGCVGRLIQFLETRDGRYLITLAGISRFRRVTEPAILTAYRQCVVDYSRFACDFQPDAEDEEVDRDGVLRAFRAFAEAKRLEIDWDGVNAASTGALVNALAAMGPFGLREKQALLEAVDLRSRAAVLIAVTEFELVRDDDAPSSLQ